MLYSLNNRLLSLRLELISLQSAHIDQHAEGSWSTDKGPNGLLSPLRHLVEADSASKREFETEALLNNPVHCVAPKPNCKTHLAFYRPQGTERSGPTDGNIAVWRGCRVESTTLPPHSVLAGVDGGAGIAVSLAATFGLALVPVLLAFGHGQFAFDPSVTEVKASGDERVALNLRLR